MLTMITASGLLLLVSVCSACDPYMMPDAESMQYTMHTADVVFQGKALGLEAQDPNSVRNYENLAVEVYCVYKFGDTDLSNYTANFTIDGDYRFNSCTTTYIEYGKEYIFALKWGEYGFYQMYEPNISTPGAYEATEDNIEKVADVCGLIDGMETEHATDMDYVCQDIPMDTGCVTPKAKTGGSMKNSYFVFMTVFAAIMCFLM